MVLPARWAMIGPPPLGGHSGRNTATIRRESTSSGIQSVDRVGRWIGAAGGRAGILWEGPVGGHAVELRDLTSFVAVAETLHFGRAAERVHVSQPTISQQVRRLEDELGVTLLQRDSRNVALTAAGAAFLERARAILGDVSDAVDRARDVGAGTAGHLVVGYVGSTLYGVVPPLVARFRQAHPGVELTLAERKTAGQFAAMREGTQDIGIIHRAPGAITGFTVRDLQREGLRVAVPAGFALARPGEVPVRVSELDGLPLVLFPRQLEPDTYDRIRGLYASHAATPRIVQEATGLHTLLGLVASRLGIAFVTDEVGRNLGRPGIVCRPVVGSPTVTTSVAWPTAAEETNPAVRRFAALLPEPDGTL